MRVLTIEHLAGLSFGDVVRAADPLHFGAAVDSGDATGASPPGGGLVVNLGGAAAGGPVPDGDAAAVPRRAMSVTIDGRGDIVI